MTLIIHAVALGGALVSIVGGWPTSIAVAPRAPIFLRVPLAWCLGLFQVLLAANALSYLLPIPLGLIAGTICAVAAPWLAAAWLRPARRSDGVILRHVWGFPGRTANLSFAALVIAAWYLATAAALWQFLWDEPEDHWINVATIAHGNFYPHLAFAPDKSLQYLYGFDLLAALLHRLTGLPVWFAIDAITAQLAPLLIWLGVAVAWLVSGSRAGALITGALFFFGGGLRVTLLSNAVHHWFGNPDGFWAAIHEVPPPLNDVYDPFVWGVHDHNRALATVAVLGLALGIAALFRPPPGVKPWVVAGVIGALMGLLALVSETDYVVAVGATAVLAVCCAIGFCRTPGRQTSPGWMAPPVRHLLMATALSGLIATAQGGLLTDALFRNPGDNPQTEFELRWPPGLPRFQKPPLGPATPGWQSGALSEFGVVLVLAPAATISAARRRDCLAAWLVTGGVAGLAIPALVAYPFLDHDMSRFAVTGTRLLMVASAPAIAAIWNWRYPLGGRGLARIAALGMLFLSLLGPLAIAAYLLPQGGQGGGIATRDPEFSSGTVGRMMGEYLKSATPQRSRVLTDIPQDLATLSGRMMPSDRTLHSLGGDPSKYAAALGELDRAAIEVLAIDYVAVTAAQWAAWPDDVKRELTGSGRFEHLTTVGQCNGDWGAIYRVRDPVGVSLTSTRSIRAPCDGA